MGATWLIHEFLKRRIPKTRSVPLQLLMNVLESDWCHCRCPIFGVYYITKVSFNVTTLTSLPLFHACKGGSNCSWEMCIMENCMGKIKSKKKKWNCYKALCLRKRNSVFIRIMEVILVDSLIMIIIIKLTLKKWMKWFLPIPRSV